MINQGIKSIITIREYPIPKRYFESGEKKKIDNTEIIIDYLHIQVDDHDAPDLEVLIKTIDYMDRVSKKISWF